jgi:tRNA 2-(methylsulfanyl)-N6-isopentenyladenosine37 hydroxylase
LAVATVPSVIIEFLDVATPEAWIDEAIERLPELLHDHANCELKAAGTALGFIYRYPDRAELAYRMSRLAREELRHFEQVRKMLADRNIDFVHVSASRYAGDLRRACREKEPERLLDILIVGALIEARSCERFAALVPRLPADIAGFYAGLLASEARHFEHYLNFARAEVAIDDDAFERRLVELKALEARLITAPDSQFRFHSGVPSSSSKD